MLKHHKIYSLNTIIKRSSLLLFCSFFLIVSCSNNEEQPDERFLEKELYDASQTRLKNGNFSNAIASLETLERRFPFGRYAEQAQAELIYAYIEILNLKLLDLLLKDSSICTRVIPIPVMHTI